MDFNYKDTLQLAKVLGAGYSKKPSDLYTIGDQSRSYEALNEELSTRLQEIAGTPQLYRENQNLLFRLMEETWSEILPRTVIDVYGQFADVSNIAQGEKAYFRRKVGKDRAKQFVTRVGLAGRYEVFELGDEKIEIQTTAYGGAARLPLEEFLDGHIMWSDYINIINEGMAEAVYKEISKALFAAIANFPAPNKVSNAGFDEAQMDRLISTVGVYGSPVIYCTSEFAQQIIPNNNWVSDEMRTNRWQQGYFANYKGGVPIIILPQSFVDETNAVKVLDPAYAYIFPSGYEKPVKIVFEGTTLIKNFENRDWSTELQTYQKFGVGVLNYNHLAVFKNTSLAMANTPGNWTP